jgi:hypothetical protein
MRTTLRSRPAARQSFTCKSIAFAALLAAAAPALAEPPAETMPSSAVVPLTLEEQPTLSEFLQYDPAHTPASPLRARTPGAPGPALDWKRSEKNDGSSALSVKKQLPFTWDAKIGADFGLGAQPSISSQPLPLAKEQNSGAAWANVTVPGVASVDARVEPGYDQNKFGTTLSRSLPLGSAYSLTLQNSYAVKETLGAPSGPAVAANPAAPAQVWSTDRLVKFNILSTGTSLGAGTSSSSLDNVTRNKLSAEQKLLGPLNVTTSVTDVGGANSNKSVTAGFKLQW